MTANILKEKLRVGKDSPVYKGKDGKWHLAKQWAITEVVKK